MEGIFRRGVPAQGRVTEIACPQPGCEGVLYSLKHGETLGRSVSPGRKVEERTCKCNVCGLDHTVRVQVRA